MTANQLDATQMLLASNMAVHIAQVKSLQEIRKVLTANPDGGAN